MLNLLLVLTQAHQSLAPGQVQGAARVLDRISSVAADRRLNLESLDTKNEMLAYAKACRGMEPDVAAKGWLKLLADIHATWSKPDVAARPKSEDVVAVLPPPAAWPAIAARVATAPSNKRTARDQALKLLCDELTGNRAAERADVNRLIEKIPSTSDNSNSTWQAARLNVLMAARSGNKEWLTEAALESCELTGDAQIWIGNQAGDLVEIVGEARSRPVLKKLLMTKAERINGMSSVGGEKTTELLVTLAIDSLPELKAAPWGLACRIPGAKLYPILAKRWPHAPVDTNDVSSRSDSERPMAKVVYAVSLELAGKHDLAVAQADDWDWPDQSPTALYFIDQALNQREYKQAFFNVEASIATKHPEKVSWDQVVRIGKEIGRSADLVALVQSTPPNKNLAERLQKILTDARVDGLLATDRLDEASALLSSEAKSSPDPRSNDAGPYDAALRLADIGILTDHPSWTADGIAEAKRFDARHSGSTGVYFKGSYRNLAELLVTLGRYPEAEACLAKLLADPGAESNYGTDVRHSLGELVKLYFHADRPADVLALFEKAPGWGGNDLADVYFDGLESYHGSKEPLGYFAAWALAKLGRKGEALRILQPCLHFARAFDPGYALLLDLTGIDAIPILDRLFARDRFEARPLIWKAEALRRAGRPGEAESVARSAISLDPSDGESPAGDRLRAYAVLADIRAEQGAAEEAAQLRSAVQAIRMAEHADDLVQAGLIQRGAEAYKGALQTFDDAYCIQSRLAVQLADEGKNDEAAEHFRRAYELMPSSFGRVESHCFGCEGVFRSEAAQHIALDVLSGIAKKTPRNPRVHYMLGYVYQAQNRRKEAMAEFKQATVLDPEYLNAWSHLAELAGTDDEAVAARAGVELAKLDPSGFHNESRLDSVEPAALWKAVDAAKSPVYLMSRNLMRIHPGKLPDYRPWDQYPQEVDWPQVAQNYRDGGNAPWRIPTTPSLRVSQLEIVSTIASLLSEDEQGRTGMGG